MEPGDRPRICVLGSINMDLVVRAPRLPAPGETILGGPFETHPGGKGANQAVAAARLGAAVTMIGCVGDDDHGRRLREAFERDGVDASRVGTSAGATTGLGVITIGESGENTIVVVSGANATMTPEDLPAHREAIAQADILLMQLETPFATVGAAAAIARDAGTTVMLNAAPGAPLTTELLSLVDVLILNETEAALLTRSGMRDGASLPGALAALPVSTVVLTLGERGCWFSHERSHVQRLAAYAIDPIDTVGAGDAFVGGLATRWAEHQISAGRRGADAMALLDALCWANAAGALACTRRGAIPSLPTRAEVLDLLRREARAGVEATGPV